jgi:ubiquinone/menaquinone biosynthesis C-methylase UbiE
MERETFSDTGIQSIKEDWHHMSIEAASRWFDDWAQAGRSESMATGHWPMVSQILPKMDLKLGLHCLDVGCGNGYAVRAMAEKVGSDGSAIGLDASPKMIEEAQAHLDNPNQARFLVSPADKIDLESESIDRLISIEALYYFPDPLAALREWNRLMAPGGSIWVMVDFYKENPYSHTWPQLVDVPMKLYSEKELRQLLEQAGFTAVISERLHNENPLSAEEQKRFQPGWGYRGVEDVLRFRNDIGSLLVCGKKSALDID